MKHMFDPEEIQEIYKEYGRAVSTAQVCEITGLTDDMVRNYTAEGILHRYHAPGKRSYRYKTKDVVKLMRAESLE